MIEQGGELWSNVQERGGRGPRRRRLAVLLAVAGLAFGLCSAVQADAAVQPRVVGGGYHSLALGDDGTLWAWGQNYYGQLGDGTRVDRRVPVRIDAGFTSVVGGGRHSLGLRVDGTLWAWGSNEFGQLGDGTRADAPAPVQVGSGFTSVAAGLSHSLAITTDGTLWAWGRNWNGQLGDGTKTDRSSPVRIGTGFLAVAGGDAHSLALKSDGTLWSWGGNVFGQLGDGTTADRWTPAQVGAGYSSVAAGASHSLALMPDGALRAWGSNSSGQVGDGTRNSSALPVAVGAGFSQIAAGMYHTAALKPDGTLWAWGVNLYGQLGDGSTVDRLAPVQVGWGYLAVGAGASHTLAVKADGTVRAWGKTYEGQLGDGTRVDRWEPFQIGSGFKAVEGGAYHSLALAADGGAWAWGQNSSAQLGDGTTIERRVPVRVGAGFTRLSGGTYHSAGIKPDGTLWTWGGNQRGQLGDGTTRDRRTPTQVLGGPSAFASVAAGELHTLALGADGTLWGWGNNAYGQVGDGTKVDKWTPVAIGSGFTAVAAGLNHSLALGTDGSLWTWGNNYGGALGDGSLTTRLAPVRIGSEFAQIAGGGNYSLAVRKDGTLWAWGFNGDGQVGDGSTSDRSAPVCVGSGYAAVAAGQTHGLALKIDGTLWGWGKNSEGQVGDGTGVGSPVPVQIGPGYAAIAAGKDHSLALKPDGTLWVWGKDFSGQLGDGSSIFAPAPVQPVGLKLKDLPPTVTATPRGGSYAGRVDVTLSSDELALIYYTLDGSEPSASSAVYATPIPISDASTLRFFGEDQAGNRSPVQTETYTVGHALTLVAKGKGSVRSGPCPDVSCGPDAVCSAGYPDGAAVLLTASAEPGSGFAGWTGCDATAGAECKVTLTGARTVTALFILDPVPSGVADPSEVVGACAGPGNGTVFFRHDASLGGERFRWSFGDGSPDWEGGDRNASVLHVYERPGTYTARLAVAESRTGAATVQELGVTVIMGPNAAPIVAAGGPYVLRAGQGLSLTASVNDPNLSCGDSVSVAWFIPADAAVPVASGAAAAVPWSELAGRAVLNGATQIRVVTTDGAGAIASAVTSLSVYDDTTTTETATSSTPTIFGQPVTFTARVAAANPAATPSGTVQFRADGEDLGPPVPLQGAQASLTTSSLTAGVHDVTAVYAGDGISRGSNGTLAGGQTVMKASAILSLDGLRQDWDGLPRSITVSTVPAGLEGVSVSYGGSAAPPTDAGTYLVRATLENANYAAEPVEGTLVVVGLPFEGFLRPVENLPFLNGARGGSAIPVKFSLGGDRGLQVLAAGYPRSAEMDCQTSAPELLAETVSAGGSGLSYDPRTDQYTYVWKTDKSWSGCRQLTLKLVDGTERRAGFLFGR